MQTVFDLWFIRDFPDRESTELHIGIYALETDARAAVEELKNQPGFCEFPQGFEIFEVRLGETGWREGFVTK